MGSSQSTVSRMTRCPALRSKTTPAYSRNSTVASRTLRAVLRGSKERRCVTPSRDLASAPLFTSKCNSQGIACAMGSAKSKRRPVTSTISMPRDAASAIAPRFSGGICALLSSSVPSISIAIIFIDTPLFYLISAFQTLMPRSVVFSFFANSSGKGTALTERIYYHDSFLREFDANVVSCEREGQRWKVILDRTAFYPTPGGQPHDSGTLGDIEVLEVVDAVPDVAVPSVVAPDPGAAREVVHYTSVEVPAGPVHGKIDWDRRLDHMQQHTAQHLLSAAFIELFGFQTKSFHLGRLTSTIDLEAPAILPRHLEEAEQRTNQIIFEDREVVVRFGTAQELAEAGIRKKVEREGLLRAIDVEGFDRQPCGGTHLARTGQAGLVLIRKLERRRDSWRIEYVAGNRALAAARSDFSILTQAASAVTCALR